MDHKMSADFYNKAAGKVTVFDPAGGAKVTFDKTFYNEGEFHSYGNSQVTFKNLAVNPTGYLKMNAGKAITVTGNLFNASTQPGDWDTDFAQVIFSGTGTHYFKTGNNSFRDLG